MPKYLDNLRLDLDMVDPHLASNMYKKIIRQINDFEENLPANMQAGGRFVNAPDGLTFSIDDVGYANPDVIIFYGSCQNGSEVQLLQHTTQLNLLLVAVPRKESSSEPRRKIGFRIDEEDNQDPQ